MTIEEMRQRKSECGYTYEQIAALSGVPLGTVQKILGGMTQSPRYDTVKALERFFSLPGGEVSDMYQKMASGRPDGLTGHAAEVGERKHSSITGIKGAEWIDGAYCESSAPTLMRQSIIAELFSQIRNYTDLHDMSEMVPLMSPVEVRPDGDDRTVLRPDVMLLCDTAKLKRWGVLGAPDFVAEVPELPGGRKTSLKKLAKYAESGVREYWLVDTEARKLIVYPLERDECLKVYKLEGKVAIGILDDLLIDLNRIRQFIRDYL